MLEKSSANSKLNNNKTILKTKFNNRKTSKARMV